MVHASGNQNRTLDSVNVPSFTFLLLVVAGALAFNLSRGWRWRSFILLAINLYFIHTFATGLWSYVPFAGFLTLGYLGIIARRWSLKFSVWLLPTLVLVVFVWLKRYQFVPHALWISSTYLTIGLSYVFFRVMHLVIDGWEEVPVGPTGLLSYLNYTLNFTSLVSGPIQRYEDYRTAEVGNLPLNMTELGRAAERIIIGLFKVYIVSALLQAFESSQLAALSDPHSWAERVVEVALVVGLYPLFLYFNFSGYTDFVIGCARLFRIELPENFDRPFRSVNFIDFWSRWHISLSQWLKNYVYSPVMLALMRRFSSPSVLPLLAVFAYFCTFFLVGAWHGQSSEFLFFGLLQGGGVATNKLYQELMIRCLGTACYDRLSRNRLYLGICRALTFLWFAFTLLWFWSNWRQIAAISASQTIASDACSVALILFVAFVLLNLLVTLALRLSKIAHGGALLVESRYVRTAWATALTVIVVLAVAVLSAPAPEIVYKAF